MRSAAILAAILLVVLTSAAAAAAPPPRVEAAWSRATPGAAAPGAAYATIVNDSGTADRLVAVTSPVAARAQLHVSVVEGGLATMRPVTVVDLAPGARLELKPGGLHVMLTGLRQPLRQGERFPLVFTFEKAGPVEAAVEVLGPGARGPGG
ncbi:MAG: copper chaperone PCu(A)C [Dongiaceae bacterium]